MINSVFCCFGDEDDAIHIFENDNRIIIQVPKALIDYVDVVCLDCGLSGIVGPDIKLPVKTILHRECNAALKEAHAWQQH
jgi:hypothetical protein